MNKTLLGILFGIAIMCLTFSTLVSITSLIPEQEIKPVVKTYEQGAEDGAKQMSQIIMQQIYEQLEKNGEVGFVYNDEKTILVPKVEKIEQIEE